MAEKQSKIDVSSWQTHFMSFFCDSDSVDLEFGLQIADSFRTEFRLYSTSCPQELENAGEWNDHAGKVGRNLE